MGETYEATAEGDIRPETTSTSTTSTGDGQDLPDELADEIGVTTSSTAASGGISLTGATIDVADISVRKDDLALAIAFALLALEVHGRYA